jgi:protoporphyrinogen oxidase
MKPKFIISGSGVSGLISALILCEKGFGADTVIIEKGDTPGGLLRKFSYDEHGDFDYGMHNFLETGIKELDDLIFGLLPIDQWQILEGEKRDLAGIYFNGKLQTRTPYFDLRNIDGNYGECLADFFDHLNSTDFTISADTKTNAQDFAIKRFGKKTAECTIIPAVEKIHKKKAQELDYMATVFTPMSRIAFAEGKLLEELTKSTELSKIIAWSDQSTLPLTRSSGRKAFYPKKYGAYRVVEAILSKLSASGVQVCTGHEIIQIETADKKIAKVTTANKDGKVVEYLSPSLLIWTSNIPGLGKYLKTDFTGLKYDKPLKTIVVNILVDKPLVMGNLYYFFCYDSNFYTYRLTNYVSYSDGAIRNGHYPICIEILVEEDILNNGFDSTSIAINELFKFGITQPETKVIFAKAEVLESGFPMPSLNNIHTLRKVRADIKAKSLKNLLLSGILAEDNLFFQTDVLIDVYKKLKNYEC